MTKHFNLLFLLVIMGLIFSIPACTCNSGNNTKNRNILDLTVEHEEIVYNYEAPNNGSHPFWCHGNAILVRNGDDVVVSGIETLKKYKPLNNVRWLLYKRGHDGWQLQQADEKDRTREPSPIGILSDGRLLMSVNPTIETDIEKYSTKNDPRVLEFSFRNLKSSYSTLLPEWEGKPPFTEHSYRTFSVDRGNNEFVLFQNIGYTHSEWVFYDREGKWHTGQLLWDELEDPYMEPFNAKHNRINYPSVVLKNKEVHFCGNSAFNKWSRIQNMEDAKRIGMDDIISTGGGRIAGGRFRRLYYTWTPDITKENFSPFLEIENSHENGENLRVLDMWLDPEGIAHLLWLKNPINKEIRDNFFPDIKRVWSLNYAKIKDGKIFLKKVLLETGDDIIRNDHNDLMDNYSISWGRYQILPDNRLFVVFHITGIDKDGKQNSENRLMEVYNDGTVSRSVAIPLEYPMSFFFTATPRGGSLPSTTIDMVGQGINDRNSVRYAKIKMNLER